MTIRVLTLSDQAKDILKERILRYEDRYEMSSSEMVTALSNGSERGDSRETGMDVRLSRAGIHDRGTDPHDWNTWDRYKFIHEKRLSEHQFVDHRTPDTLRYSDLGSSLIRMTGLVFCLGGVTLEVDKSLRQAYVGNSLKVRGVRYRYVAWLPRGSQQGKAPVLRYHNIHRNDQDYHHRVFNPQTGELVGYETLRRFQFPTLGEIIDEIAVVLELYPLE